VQAFGQKLRQPFLCLRDRIGAGDADGTESERGGLLAQGVLDGLRLGQKSRSA
jgi:hypothetical protein